MSLKEKLLKSVKKNAYASVFSESKVLDRKSEFAQTTIPMINIAFSGKWDGGVTPGITILAGESKNGKTYIGLFCVKAYLDKYKDAYCVFFDTELGANAQYMENLNIDTSRIIHVPVTNIEEAKFQTMQMLEEIENGEKVIFFFDSIGNIASKKEVDDALEGKSVADMSRAKQLKSYFRMITPHINLKGLTFIGINHVYSEIGLFPKTIMGGGQGPMLAADTVFFLTKAKEKDGREVIGFDFKLRVAKSRFIREDSVFALTSSFELGMDKYSDLFEFGLESGFITSPTKGYYSKHEKYGDPKKYRRNDFLRNDAMWEIIINDEEFQRAYEDRYRLKENMSDNISAELLTNDDESDIITDEKDGPLLGESYYDE